MHETCNDSTTLHSLDHASFACVVADSGVEGRCPMPIGRRHVSDHFRRDLILPARLAGFQRLSGPARIFGGQGGSGVVHILRLLSLDPLLELYIFLEKSWIRPFEQG